MANSRRHPGRKPIRRSGDVAGKNRFLSDSDPVPCTAPAEKSVSSKRLLLHVRSSPPEHVFQQVRLCRHVMIKLNVCPIRFISGLQRNLHRWFLLKRVIQKQDLFLPQSSGQKGIPQPPNPFPNRTNGKQKTKHCHPPQLRQTSPAANTTDRII